MQGIKVTSISKTNLKNTILQFPKELEEQKRIGKLFIKLNRTITLHEEKQRQLEQLKKALLQKMFADETGYPVLRFKGFTAKWEQRKLGEIFNERKEKSENSNEQLLSVTINDGVVKSDTLDRKSNASKDKSNYKIVNPDDIAYNSMRMWQGSLGVSSYYGIVSPAYTVISVRNVGKDNPYFYKYSFKRSRSLNVFRKHSQGLTPDTWNLKYPLFKQIKYQAPSLIEQEKIGQLFQSLDKTITLHDKKIQYLKQLKRGLLQKMFV